MKNVSLSHLAVTCRQNRRRALFLLTGTLLCLLLSSPFAFGQSAPTEIAVVVNTLTQPDLGITPSLSFIDLMEPSAVRAVANEHIRLSEDPQDRRRYVGLAIDGHLAYLPSFDLPSFNSPSTGDSILIVNLQERIIVGEIPLRAGSSPQQVALINENKLYVTCADAHEVHVVDIANRNVTHVITGPFNKPTGITLLNGKAYVTNPAWLYDPLAQRTFYFDSSVTVIDTATDRVIADIPTPINAGGILTDGDATVIVKTTGNYNDIPGYLVFIEASTDTVTETVNLGFTPGSFALNAESRLFIQGSWQNPGLLVYDTLAQDWIRDEDDTIAAFSNDPDASLSGGLTFAPNGDLYITQPDWSGSGQDYVRVMDVTDAALLETYHVGLGASILGFATIITNPADINNDGVVDTADLNIAARFFGDAGDGLVADVNRDGVVDILDLVLIRAEF